MYKPIPDPDNDDYRFMIYDIMDCLWHLGRTLEAERYRTLILENLAKDYEGCAELGKTLETLYANACNGRCNKSAHVIVGSNADSIKKTFERVFYYNE